MIMVLEEIPQTTLQHRMRLACLRQLRAWYELIDEEPMFLSVDRSDTLAKLGRNFCGLYSKLAEDRMMNGELVWNVTVKAHYFLHMCKQAADLNPRFAWVYQDEDFVGRISRIASSVAGGGPTRLGKGLVIKYLRLMYIRIKSRILQNHAHLFMNDADDDADEEGGDDA